MSEPGTGIITNIVNQLTNMLQIFVGTRYTILIFLIIKLFSFPAIRKYIQMTLRDR